TFAGRRWTLGGAPAPAAPEFVDLGKLPAGSVVLSAARTPAGAVWVVTREGAFRSEGGRYAPVSLPSTYLRSQPHVDPDARPTCVAVDTDGHVWLGTTAGAYATDGANWWIPADAGRGLPYRNVTCIALPANGDTWIG